MTLTKPPTRARMPRPVTRAGGDEADVLVVKSRMEIADDAFYASIKHMSPGQRRLASRLKGFHDQQLDSLSLLVQLRQMKHRLGALEERLNNKFKARARGSTHLGYQCQ